MTYKPSKPSSTSTVPKDIVHVLRLSPTIRASQKIDKVASQAKSCPQALRVQVAGLKDLSQSKEPVDRIEVASDALKQRLAAHKARHDGYVAQSLRIDMASSCVYVYS